MKKNFSRALSLLLVLVMLLGAMPMALAGENDLPDQDLGDPTPVAPTSISVTASPANPKVGETVTFTAHVPEGYTASGSFAWTGAIGSGATATAVMTAEGAYAASVSVTVRGEAGTLQLSGNAAVTVAPAEDDTKVELILTANREMRAETQQTISVSVSPATAEKPALTWSSSDSSVATVSNAGVVSAKKAGTVVITATSTADPTVTASVDITVTAKAVELTVSTASLTLAPKEVGTIYWNCTPASARDYVTLSMKSANTRVAQVDGSTGRVTAIAAGDTTVTVTASLNRNAPDTLKFANGKTSQSVTVPVTVTNQYYISCSNESVRSGSRTNLSPILYDGTGNRVTNATFTYSYSGSVSITSANNQSFSVTSNTPGTASITFTANGYTNDGKAITKTVDLGFYRSADLKVSVRDNISSFRFYDRGVITSAISSSQNYNNLNNLAMADLIGYAMPISGVYNDVDYYSFGISGSNGGELLAPTSGSSLNWTTGTKYVDSNNIDAVGFQQKSSSNKVSNFTIYAMSGSQSDGVIVGMLTLQITAGAASSGIEYSTTYNKSVTFKASDFQSYWNAHKNDSYSYSYNNNNTVDCGCHNQYYCTNSYCRYYDGTNYNSGYTTASLSYVTFGISNTVPAYGTLYTTSSKTTKVTAGYKFAPTTTTNSGYYALNSVTYVPATNYTSAYNVDIPFTAYGTDGTSITGYVTIKLNEQGNTIGARGTTIDASVAESIAANYYNAKGQAMGYVIFDLPSAQQATLFRSIPKVDGHSRVTEATRVQSGDRFYYYTTNNGYTYGSTYDQYVNNNNTNKVNCGCNNLYYCTNTWCKYYDGNSSTVDCGCHNNYYCSNNWCMYYDGTNYNYNNNYNNNNQYSTNQMKLTDVSVVPAAGFKGKLTLAYTAYTAGGSLPYNGYITYDVETKTASAVFSDVKGSYSWAADSADFLYYEGTAQGSNGKYNPAANITRGDFMLMLYRAFLEEEYGDKTVTSNFSDVVKGNTSYSQETYQAVGIAKQLGIAQGTNNKFNPTSKITREEAMVLIYRTLNEINRSLRYKSSTSASSFNDYSKISSWATSAISDLVSHGVIQGSNDKINPKSNITRAEMACILHRVITY